MMVVHSQDNNQCANGLVLHYPNVARSYADTWVCGSPSWVEGSATRNHASYHNDIVFVCENYMHTC